MKKLLLFFTILLSTTTAFSQGVMGLINRSEDFFTTMNTGKFDEAVGFLDVNMQAQVKPEMLKELWTKLTAQIGPYQTLDVVQSKTEGEHFVVIVEGKFEKDTQRFLLAYNKVEKMVGFYLQPKANSSSYTTPSYVDTAAFKQTEIKIKGVKNDLVGMLTLPKTGKNFPVVILVHGSGVGDMDQSIGALKPFKDIALGLASNGIASIRYVKRTLVYPNEYTGAFTVKEETTNDAVTAINLAKTYPEIDKKQIYVFGLSLGGMLAPRIATLAPDIKGIILAAAPARKFTDMIIYQSNYMFGLANDTTAKSKEMFDKNLKAIETTRLTKLGTIKPDSAILGLPASYWVDLNNYDQVATAKKLSQRIMVIQGSMDFQVTEVDFKLWTAALSKKSNATLKLYPDLNHPFTVQTEKGTAEQYKKPGNVSEVVIKDLATWIKASK
jgi:dienelactone hydrolase